MLITRSSKEIFGASKNETSTNSTTDVKSTKDEENDEEVDDENKDEPSLLEKAAEYEAKRAFTHPSANIQGDTSTGEEHEITKFQVE